jgi:hypothetical protein
MLVIEVVKGAHMFDWHSEYLMIQARQRDIAAAASFGRLLAGAGRKASSGGTGRERGAAPRPAAGLRYRAGAALVLLGRRLQGGSSGLAEKY